MQLSLRYWPVLDFARRELSQYFRPSWPGARSPLRRTSAFACSPRPPCYLLSNELLPRSPDISWPCGSSRIPSAPHIVCPSPTGYKAKCQRRTWPRRASISACGPALPTTDTAAISAMGRDTPVPAQKFLVRLRRKRSFAGRSWSDRRGALHLFCQGIPLSPGFFRG